MENTTEIYEMFLGPYTIKYGDDHQDRLQKYVDRKTLRTISKDERIVYTKSVLEWFNEEFSKKTCQNVYVISFELFQEKTSFQYLKNVYICHLYDTLRKRNITPKMFVGIGIGLNKKNV